MKHFYLDKNKQHDKLRITTTEDLPRETAEALQGKVKRMNKELFKIYADLRQVMGAVKESLTHEASVGDEPIQLFEKSLERLEGLLFPASDDDKVSE